MFFVLCWGAFSVCVFGKENFPAVNRCLCGVLYLLFYNEFIGYCTGARNCKLYYLPEQFRKRHSLMVQLGCSELIGKNNKQRYEHITRTNYTVKISGC